jgi:hypothetical protein
MSMYRAAVEWKAKDGGQKSGYVFFEADSKEQAHNEVREAVEIAIHGEKNDLVIHDPTKYEPVCLVMWDLSEIAALDAHPNLVKLERVKLVTMPKPPQTAN